MPIKQLQDSADNQDLNTEEEEPIDDVEEEEIMDDEEEMEIPAPEDGSPGHFVIQGKPVVSSPPQMLRYSIILNMPMNNKFCHKMCYDKD